MSRNALLWMLWSLLTFVGAGAVFAALYIGGDRTVLLPVRRLGPTTSSRSPVKPVTPLTRSTVRPRSKRTSTRLARLATKTS